MKRLQYTLLALAVATLTAACDNSDVFYTTTYPIVKIGVTVEPATISGTETTAEENPGEEEPTDPPTEEPTDPTPEPTPAVPNPIIPEVEEEVQTAAPVQVGGSYTLDFTKYNGGQLHVRPSANAASLSGTFVKRPASDSLAFNYNSIEYVCVRDTYKDEETGVQKVKFTVDLTAYYQEKHPDANITKVLRTEYTSANAK